MDATPGESEKSRGSMEGMEGRLDEYYERLCLEKHDDQLIDVKIMDWAKKVAGAMGGASVSQLSATEIYYHVKIHSDRLCKEDMKLIQELSMYYVRGYITGSDQHGENPDDWEEFDDLVEKVNAGVNFLWPQEH